MHKKLSIALIIFLFTTSCQLVTFLPESPTSTPEQIIIQPIPTDTPIPPTQTNPPPTDTPEPSATPEPPKPFDVLAGAPLFSPAFLHTDLGCDWMGVAGQVFDMGGTPLSNLVITLTGSLGSEAIEAVGYTGAATGYGPGGYEIKLSDQAAPGVFWIEVHDLEGTILTESFSFEMNGSCDQNLAIINFIQVEGDYQLVLPVITR